MIVVEEKKRIRRAHYIDGKSIPEIRRETGHHREIIRKALEESNVPRYTRKKPPPSPELCQVKPTIDQWLGGYDASPTPCSDTVPRRSSNCRLSAGGIGVISSSPAQYAATRS